MGLLGFLRFSLFCFDFLAWPVFALGYPLWASIRAIETSSKHHMRKLVTYWTIFSLMSLFEIFFIKLILWVPFWPYIKLVAIFWLVIPQFNGACHVYQCLVHPCLSFNLQDIMNWFCIPKEKPSNKESFLVSAETYLKENGPEALEKLIAEKAKHKEHILTDSDAVDVVKKVEPTEENVTAEQLVARLKPLLVESAEETAAAEAQMLKIPTESKEKIPLKMHGLKKVQREWTCAMCQVTTSSEVTLKSHLLGMKHRSNCEKLNTGTQTVKNLQSSAVQQKSMSEELKTSTQTGDILKYEDPRTAKQKSKSEELKTSTQTGKNLMSEELKTSTQTLNNLKSEEAKTAKQKSEELKTSTQDGNNLNLKTSTSVNYLKSEELKTVNQKSKFEELKTSTQTVNNSKSEELKTSTQTGNNLKSSAVKTNDSSQAQKNLKICLPVERSKQNTTEKPKAAGGQQMQEKYKEWNAGVINQQSKLWCAICKVTCSREIDLNAHFKGKRHLYNINQQKKLWCAICNIACPGEIDMNAHLKGKKHLDNMQSTVSSLCGGQA